MEQALSWQPLRGLALVANLQQETAAKKRNLAMVDTTIRGWPGTNDAQQGQLRHFASSGLGLESRWLDPSQPSSGEPVRLRLRKFNSRLQQLKHHLTPDRICVGRPTRQHG